MKLFFRVLIMIALSIWLGGLFFFPFLAAIAFSAESSQQAAGLIVGSCLIVLHEMGIACGLLILAVLMAVLLKHATRRTVFPAIVLLLIMFALTCVSHFWVIPHMETYRVAAGGSIVLAPADNPDRIAFERLHKVSVAMELSVLLLGLTLIVALAWVDSGESVPKVSPDAD